MVRFSVVSVYTIFTKFSSQENGRKTAENTLTAYCHVRVCASRFNRCSGQARKRAFVIHVARRPVGSSSSSAFCYCRLYTYSCSCARGSKYALILPGEPLPSRTSCIIDVFSVKMQLLYKRVICAPRQQQQMRATRAASFQHDFQGYSWVT